jgi:HEAT repeat protein
MTKPEQTLVVVFGGIFLLWLGIALYLVVARAIYDFRAALVRSARHIAERPLRTALERGAAEDELWAATRRLPWRTVFRLAADTSVSPALRAPLARAALARKPVRVLELAKKHRSEIDRWKRIAALRIIATAQWPQAIPLLRDALAAEDEDVVGAAVTILGARGDDDAVALLVGALRDGRYSQSRIASHLDTIELKTSAPLLELLDDFDPRVRFWGATLLARYAGRSDVAVALVARTGDPEANVRAAAVESLSEAGNGPATAAALGLLDDPVGFVRAHAARTLGKIGGGAVENVQALLADEQWWVRAAAKDALTEGGVETVRPLIAYLDHPDRFARNGAAELLQQSGLLDELIAAAANDPDDELKRQMLKRIFAAGSRRLPRTSIERGNERSQELIRELDTGTPPDSVVSA